MRALIRMEIRRLLSRRLFRVLTILVIVGFSIAGVLTFINSDDSPAAVAAADAERETAIRQCIDHFRAGAGSAGEASARSGDAREMCEEEVWVPDPRFVYIEVEWILMSMGIPLIMLGWLVGASFMGAEWHSRTITATLTWESRRVRVLAAKAVSVTVVVLFWVALLQVFLASVLYPAGALKGTTAGVNAAFWGTLSGVGLRVAGAGAIASLLGFSLAALGRSTAAALGAGFVQLALVESLIRRFRPGWVDWLIGDNLGLFLVGPEEVGHLSHSQLSAGLLLAGYAVALLAGAAAIFRTREVA